MSKSPGWDDAWMEPFPSPYCTGEAVMLDDAKNARGFTDVAKTIHSSNHVKQKRGK